MTLSCKSIGAFSVLEKGASCFLARGPHAYTRGLLSFGFGFGIACGAKATDKQGVSGVFQDSAVAIRQARWKGQGWRILHWHCYMSVDNVEIDVT
jgi:hypothetical protein